jgi:hypothetical protein
MWATSVIFKKLLIVNNRPLGKNSPNLVILAPTHPLFPWSLTNGLFTRTVILTVSDATAASNTAQK